LTGTQLWNLVMLETGLMGVVAGLLAIPAGYALAWVLVDVINQRSFGWTLQLEAPGISILQGLATAVIAALLAGLYPAWRINRMAAAEAMRYD
jgi:putative ABC transport system permease protein